MCRMQAIIMIAIIVCIKCHDEELAVQTETENHYIGEYVVDCVYIFTWRRVLIDYKNRIIMFTL